jgi:hypothetical protein
VASTLPTSRSRCSTGGAKEALSLYERKGNLVSAARARAALAHR